MKMADEKNVDITQKGLFQVGSHVKCRFQGEEVEGTIAAFNASDKMLLIRAPSTCGKSSHSDFIVINADCVEKVSVEEISPTENLKPVDFQKLDKRRVKTSQTKKTKIRALSSGVSVDGRKLFLSIMKTIDEVTWDGETIVVLNEVRIPPPYKTDNVEGNKEASKLHVRKIVDKHWKDLAGLSS